MRNTIALRGKGGPGHGPLPWSANFDEVQNFENDIRNVFGGSGFMDDATFNSGTHSDPLGDAKAGQYREFDLLAAYLASLTEFSRSPYRNADGTLTDMALAGAQLFRQRSCAECHIGEVFSDSGAGTLDDVGTLEASSGQRRGEQLTGLDTPTLRGLWVTAPDLHDGTAASLLDVTENVADLHGGTSALSALQRQQLVAYLLQTDDNEPPATPAAPPTPPANELLDNGSFEQDLGGWQTQLSGIDSEARLGFVIGGEGPRTLWFDNISFEDDSSSSPPPPPPQPPLACRACGGDCNRRIVSINALFPV